MQSLTKASCPADDAETSKTIANFPLKSGETLGSASESKVIILVFLRQFGCTFTRQLLRRLEEIQAAATLHAADLILVHMLRDGAEVEYLRDHSDIARIADPSCNLYRAFGLKKGGFLALFGPRVWWFALISIFKGCGIGRIAGDERQMPGIFLYHKRNIIASQRAKSASDLPDLNALFRFLPQADPSPKEP
ncbi:MAG: hypothetical protein H8M99_06155 [Gloeobacteraceae cyanobacterium ES-bin-144]|nr:hypothetical protein [Verrucomicrobiales bacterium]